MNIIRFELRSHLRSLCFYILGITLLVVLSFSKIDMTHQENIDLIRELLSDMPVSLQYFMSYHPQLDLSMFQDYYMLIYPYVVLIVSIYAITLGVSMVTKEELEHVSSFLYTMPLTRREILKSKLEAGMILNLVLAFSYTMVLIMIYAFRTSSQIHMSVILDIVLLGIIQTLTQLIFYMIGFLIGVYTHIHKSQQYALIFVVVSYMLAKLIDIFQWTFLNTISIFTLLDPLKMLYLGQWQPIIVFMLLVIVSVGVVLSFNYYDNKDLAE